MLRSHAAFDASLASAARHNRSSAARQRGRRALRRDRQDAACRQGPVIVLGVILLIVGFLASIPILWTIGIIVLVVGLVLALLGRTGRAVGGRAHYY
jgi:hypothetical protein